MEVQIMATNNIITVEQYRYARQNMIKLLDQLAGQLFIVEQAQKEVGDNEWEPEDEIPPIASTYYMDKFKNDEGKVVLPEKILLYVACTGTDDWNPEIGAAYEKSDFRESAFVLAELSVRRIKDMTSSQLVTEVMKTMDEQRDRLITAIKMM
jgi:hypothetical protein